MDVWIGIEVQRGHAIVDGAPVSPALRNAGGVNLLRHQLKIALEAAPPERVRVLTPDADEALLEICGEFGVTDTTAPQLLSSLAGRAAADEEGAFILLRQSVPLADASELARAVNLLNKRGRVVSASIPPQV